jgi:Fic/DOC family
MNAIAASMTIVRPPLRFPDWDAMPNAFKRMVGRLEVQADATREAAARSGTDATVAIERLAMIPWHRYENELQHPLSARWLQRGGGHRGAEVRDVVAEFEAYRDVRTTLSDGLTAADADGFLQALKSASQRLCPEGAGDFRSTPIGLEPDADGTVVCFGDWSQVSERLRELFSDYRQSALPPTMKALSSMAVLLNIHPFADGNGRCARALFNAAYSGDAIMAYVPLRAALEASTAGFEMRLREAETNGNWAPIVTYLTTVLAIVADNHAAELK